MNNIIIHPLTNEKLNIFSVTGKKLLKAYVYIYKNGGSEEQIQKIFEELKEKSNFSITASGGDVFPIQKEKLDEKVA